MIYDLLSFTIKTKELIICQVAGRGFAEDVRLANWTQVS